MCSSVFSYVKFEVLFTPEHPQVEMINFCPKTLFIYVETATGTFLKQLPDCSVSLSSVFHVSLYHTQHTAN